MTGTGYFALVRSNPDFRNLWAGQIVSLFGDWFNLIASASLVASLTGSGLAVGGLFVVRMLAPFLVSPLAGVAADRYDRKKLLIVTDFVRAVVVLGFLFVREPSHIWLLYALTASQLAMTGFFFPTRNAILPDIVRPEELGSANAITATTWSVMLALGAAAGGLVTGGFGIYSAFVIDSVTFLVSAAFLARIRHHREPHERSQGKSVRAALHDYADGLRYLEGERDVLAVSLHKAMLTLFVAGAHDVVLVTLAKDVFPIGEGSGISLGLLYAAIGAGSGVGPIAARWITGDRDLPMRLALFFSYVAMFLGLGIMSTLMSFRWVLFGAFVRALGGGSLWVFSTQILLQRVPDRVRGRVFATEFAFLTLSFSVSAALGGFCLDRAGFAPDDLLRLMAGSVLLPGFAWLFWVLRRK